MTIKLMPFKQRFAVLTAVIALLALSVGWIYSRPSLHSMIILNRGSNDVVITKIRVDDNGIDSRERILWPIGPTEKRNTPGKYLDYSFEAGRKAILSLDFTDSTGKKETLSCDLVDQYAMGCVYYVSIKKIGELACVCDSNSDFID